MSDVGQYYELARRALTHLRNGTTDQAPSTLSLPIDAYRDAARYRLEYEAIFLRQPLGLVLSAELPEPGNYVARTVLGKPLLLVRGNDKVVRAFLNVCRHRGAKVCKEGAGTASRFVCPYHAWTYGRQGELAGMYGKDKFGNTEGADLRLTSLGCAERAGIVWGVLTPGIAFDVDDWLGGFAAKLESLELDRWHVVDQREIPGPGWKVTMDGYLEAYHHDQVHAKTLALHTLGNLLVHDTFGPHQRLVMGRKNLAELGDRAERDWQPLEHLRLIHSIFPNMSISGILGDYSLVSQIMPGDTLEQTVTRQTILAAKKPVTEDEVAKSRAFSAMAELAVAGEDYPVGLSIQAGLHSGANSAFLIGRNEPGIQHYHRMVEQFSAQAIPR